MDKSKLIEEMRKYEVSDMCNHEVPVVWDKADDFYIYDKEGNKWIDFTSGIFVANVGHGAQKVKEAITNQTNKLIHSYIFPNEPRVKLAKKLCDIAGMEKVLFTVTGSEANDAVIQMMQRNREGKILSIGGAYYGSTIGCRALANNVIDEYTSPEKLNPAEISGLFLQAFRGKDANFMPYNWIQIWVKWAQDNNIPVGFDEMQSGIGRTGKWFGFQHYNIKPDFITVGKALGGGLPISAVVGNDLLKRGEDLWSTHSGNPVCCASALATLETIEEQGLIEKTAEKNDWFAKLLTETFPDNKIYGQGMIWAIYTGDENATQMIIKKCAQNGLLLVSTYGLTIKIGPPLTISDEALKEGIQILKRCFA